MTLTLLSAILVAGVGTGSPAEFQPPTRLMADGVPVRVENPGWACPCWADMDGDGFPEGFVVNPKGDIVCLDLKTGKPKWTGILGEPVMSAPAIRSRRLSTAGTSSRWPSSRIGRRRRFRWGRA